MQDLALLAALIALCGYVLFQVNVFVKPGQIAEHAIEADEMPILGLVSCFGLLLFSWRRLQEQKRETAARIQAQEQLSQLAFQDALTGLPNRRSLIDQVNVSLSSPPGSGAVHALLMLDLNGFKHINDVYGHGAGDQVLITVGQRLLRAVRDGDLVARLGGDEFAVLTTQMPSNESVTSIALRIIEELNQPIVISNVEHIIGAGIGICGFPADIATPDEILRLADLALYRAKPVGTSAFRFYDEAMDKQALERNFLEMEFRSALVSQQIEPYFQPLVDLKTNRIVGFEALARWTHPSLGELAPERFIAIAESTGLIGALTDQLLSSACKAAGEWPDYTFLSFNVSGFELQDRTLSQRILKIIEDAGFPPHRLEIEITESSLVRDIRSAAEVIESLRSKGVSIALDDFGTGYSSLYHLRNFRPDKIKIDRSFVHSMQDDPQTRAIIAALVGLGRGLGLTVTAEGIEKESEELTLEMLGCQQGQGYFFGKAVTAIEASALFIMDQVGNLAKK